MALSMYYDKFSRFKKLAPELLGVSDFDLPELITSFYFIVSFNQLQEDMGLDDMQVKILVDNCMEIYNDEYSSATNDAILEAIYQYCHGNPDYSTEELLTCTSAIVDTYFANFIADGGAENDDS